MALGGGLFGDALNARLRINDDWDDDWQDDYAMDEAYMSPQQVNEWQRDQGASDVPMWQRADTGWGDDEWVRNPYYAGNREHFEEHGGREQAVKDLGEKSHWADFNVRKLGPGEELDDYWAFTADPGWYESQGWDDTIAQQQAMTQAAQSGTAMAQAVPDEDQN